MADHVRFGFRSHRPNDNLNVFDAGLQPERTVLAWQRTTLAAVIGSAISAKLLAQWSPIAALVIIGTMVVILAIMSLQAYLRYVRFTATRRTQRSVPTQMWTVAMVVLLGVNALILWTVKALAL